MINGKKNKKLVNNNTNNTNIQYTNIQVNKCSNCGGDIVVFSRYNTPALSSVGKKYKVCKQCGRVY